MLCGPMGVTLVSISHPLKSYSPFMFHEQLTSSSFVCSSCKIRLPSFGDRRCLSSDLTHR
jgi:hypothetical protein